MQSKGVHRGEGTRESWVLSLGHVRVVTEKPQVTQALQTCIHLHQMPLFFKAM